MKVSGQLRTPAAFSPVLIGQEIDETTRASDEFREPEMHTVEPLSQNPEVEIYETLKRHESPNGCYLQLNYSKQAAGHSTKLTASV
jgi:hypothetical protein